MEVGPVIQSREAISQPDLLEVFAEQEVTIFGVSGTFKDLAEMCPVDLNDVSISVEAKNEFVVKAANEAGLGIEPKYEAVFKHHTEKLGLERKFTVVEKEVKPQKEIADTQKPAETQVELLQTSTKARRSVVEKHSVVANTEQHSIAEAILAKVTEVIGDDETTARLKGEAEKSAATKEIHEDNGQSDRSVVGRGDERLIHPQNIVVELEERTINKKHPVSDVIATAANFDQINQSIKTNSEQTDMVETLPVTTDAMTPEDAQPEMAEVADAANTKEVNGEYNLFEENEVVLLMAAIGQGQVLIDENNVITAQNLEVQDIETELSPLRIMKEGFLVAVPELPSPIEQIETTISALAEVFENAEDVAMGRCTQVLEAIINLPEMLDTLEVSPRQKENIAEEKAEALFIELFEEAGIEYTPELIKTFVILTRAHYLDELFVAAKVETGETLDLPTEIGTREFLQKLQHGLSAMKRAVINFYEVGKSILRIYTSNFETATVKS